MPGGSVAGHRHEPAGVRPDLEIVGGAEHHLEHRPSGSHRPIGGQHPFGVIAERRPHRQRHAHRHPGGAQHARLADAGQHQQVRRFNGAGAQHDSVGGQRSPAVRADHVGAPGDGAGETQPRHPGVRLHAQVGPAQRGDQIPRTRALADAVDDVQRDRADPRNRLGRSVIEVVDPAESGAPRGVDETLCGSGHFAGAADQDRAAAAVRGSVEVQVGLDGAEAVQHVRPCPARQAEAVEIAAQPAAEVAAVDRARAADGGAAHQRVPAGGPLGELGLVSAHQRAADADRQLQPVGGPGEQRRVVEGRARLDHGHRAPWISGKTFGDNRSGAAGADYQHIAVRDGVIQGRGLTPDLGSEGARVALP